MKYGVSDTGSLATLIWVSTHSMLIHLPAPNKRPEKTKAISKFTDAISKLNDFYWGTRASYLALEHIANDSPLNLPAVISALHTRWKVDASEVSGRLTGLEDMLLGTCLVLGVSAYEDYLYEILNAGLRQQPMPGKKPRMEIDLSSVPNDKAAHQFVFELWVVHKTNEVLKEGYSKRHGQLESALGISIEKTHPRLPFDGDGLKLALEVRNCIVHANGVADARAVRELKGQIPNVTQGDPLPLNDALLFRALNAMLQHAGQCNFLSVNLPRRCHRDFEIRHAS